MVDEPGIDVDASDMTELLGGERSLASVGDDAMKARVHARAKRTLGITPGPSGGGGPASNIGAGSSEAKPFDPQAERAPRRGLRHSGAYLYTSLAAAVCLFSVLHAYETRSSRAVGHIATAATAVTMTPDPATISTPASAEDVSEIPTFDVGALPSIETPARQSAARSAHAAPIAPHAADTVAPGVTPGASIEAEPAPEGSDFASERAVIAELRNAMNRRDYPGAERALDEHAHRFPHGQLVEQRKALEIWLLEQTGRRGLARERAAQFKSEHPNSVMQRALGGS